MIQCDGAFGGVKRIAPLPPLSEIRLGPSSSRFLSLSFSPASWQAKRRSLLPSPPSRPIAGRQAREREREIPYPKEGEKEGLDREGEGGGNRFGFSVAKVCHTKTVQPNEKKVHTHIPAAINIVACIRSKLALDAPHTITHTQVNTSAMR